MRRHHWLLAALVLVGLWVWSHGLRDGSPPPSPATVPAPATAPGAGRDVELPASTPTPAQRPAAPLPDFLPPEAGPVLAAIERGGPFEYRQDGGVFQNRERRLPARPRGYYREYTVDTPGSDDRGARRIVTGGDPPTEYWYTADHYRSFRRFDPPGATR
ncbi:ribonuclease domain-containing protein [Cognatilysobacter tabacisoli]|uniref:ribonuclease domain-containing protein n=1 Tax=Cognatilysobacter tabacisoli TaxID=2315424 RepID=UPI000E6AF40A|nr:ribonuclease domain-containing protein [Lysobacter tabacisoli]